MMHFSYHVAENCFRKVFEIADIMHEIEVVPTVVVKVYFFNLWC